MKKTILIFITVLALVLTGCQPVFNSDIEQLLAAPQLSKTQQQVVNALADYLGETVKLKYPRNGENLSPFLFYDLDGNGNDEVIVTYTTQNKGKNVQLAVLQKKDSGKWLVVFETEGIDTDIDSVSFAHILPGEDIQMIVGYSNLNLSDKYLVVYSCQDLTLQSMYEQPYYSYCAADMTQDGQTDIAAISAPSQMGRLQLSLVTAKNGVVTNRSVTNLDSSFTSCAGFKVSRSQWHGNYIVVDGYVSANQIATQVFYCSADGFVRCQSVNGYTIPQLTQRSRDNLLSMDLDDDGMVEVPVITEIGNDTADSGFCWVSWYEFEKNSAMEDVFGIADTNNGYFIALPKHWENSLSLLPGMLDDWWILSNSDTGEVYMNIRVLQQGENLSAQDKGLYTQVAAVGENRVYIRLFKENMGGVQPEEIINGVVLIG